MESQEEKTGEKGVVIQMGLVTFLSVLVFFFIKIGRRLNKGKMKEATNELNVNSLPGPGYLIPFIGNALQMLPLQNTLNVWLKWCTEYGAFFKLTLAGETFVVLNSAPAIQALLKSTQLGHIVKVESMYKELATYAPNGVLTSKGQLWKTNRKILAQSMSIQSLKNYVPKVNKHCSRLIKTLCVLYQDKQVHTLNTPLSAVLFGMIGELITGLDLHHTSEGEKVHSMIMSAQELMIKKILQPWLQVSWIWNLHPDSKMENEMVAFAEEFTHSIIQRRRQARAHETSTQPDFVPVSKKSVVDILLDANLDDKLMAEELVVMFVAGHHTSATALHFFCFTMAQYPDIQQKCREEINSVWEKDTELSWEALNNLKYVEQCVNESMRLYPAVPLIGRTLEESLKLDNDVKLGCGTNVLIMPYTLHRNPEYFPNPSQFDPDRFTPEEIAKRPTHSYIPFSLGIRNCLGFQFALVELKAIACHILRKFELSSPHKLNDVPVLTNMLLKPEKDYEFSCKILF